MDYLIAGKLAFVAAGAHGIGAATADLLTGEGARVIVADSDGAALAEKQGRWHATITTDLATAPGVDDAVAQVLETFGRAPDILINNLGVGNATPFEDISEERWERSFNINLMGSVRTLRALLPKMADVQDAAVVNTGSDLAKQPEPAFMDYGACKAGLLYVTKALAKQYAPRIRVNAVLPGPSSTSSSPNTASIATRRSSGSWRIDRCRWGSDSRRTWRTQLCFSRRRAPSSSPARPSTSAAPSGV